MSRNLYLALLVACSLAYAAWLGFSPAFGAQSHIVHTTAWIAACSGLTMARKQSKQQQDRSREAGSIERRASEIASEQAFIVALVVILVLLAVLSFAMGLAGFLIGAAGVLVAWASFWGLYRHTLRAMLRD